jgi:hypothetical protein
LAVRIHQLVWADSQDFGPGAPVIAKGALDIVGATGFVDDRIALKRKVGLREGIARLRQQNLQPAASVLRQDGKLALVQIDRGVLVGGRPVVDVVLRRVVVGVRMAGPHVESPQRRGNGVEHGVQVVQIVVLAARR